MKTSQKGFTLVELVVVIVLLGILGVTALGKFQDLSTDAQTAANNGIASEISASSAINFAATQLNTSGTTAVVTGSVTDCATAATDFLAVPLDASDYTVSAGTFTDTCANTGDNIRCEVADSGSIGTAATAVLLCTGP